MGRRMHGKLVPHYQMYFGGNGMAHGALAIKGPSVPAARIEAALEKVKLAYSSNCEVNETFFSWTRRFGKDRLAALLESVIEVKPEELTSVLRDHGKDSDFKVLQLGGGECAGVSQVKIGSSFFEAAHERNYRNAFKFQRKFEDSVKCAEEITRLIAQGVTELLGGQKYENLQEQAEELERSLPTKPQLSKQLKKLAEYFVTPGNDLNDALLTEWFLELDQWTLEVAEFCLSFDAQLDLSGSLPQSSGINQS